MREIEFKPSRLMGVLLLGMAALALLALWLAAMPDGMRLLLAVAAMVLLAWAGRRASRAVRWRLAADGGLQRQDETGAWREVEVLGDSFVSPALIVLRYRMDGQPHSLTLLPDSAAADDLRRLRVSLRWARRTRSDTSSPGAG